MKKYIYLLISLFFAAINLNLFLKPLNLVTGGTQGLAIIINNITSLKLSFIILIINIIALLLSFILLKKETTKGTIISTFAYPIFVKITSYIPTINFINNYQLITALIAGTICGTTGGIIYKLNFSSGGITIINLLLRKYFNIKVSISNFIINTIIIVAGCFFFGITKMLYSLIVITISSFIIHFIMKKIDNKQHKVL